MRSPCPECGSTELQTAEVVAQSLHFNLLPHIGSLGAKVQSVVCMDCGSMRLFVPRLQQARIRKSEYWSPVDVAEGGGSAADETVR